MAPKLTIIVAVMLIACFAGFCGAQDCICSPTINLKGFDQDNLVENVSCIGLKEMEAKILAKLDFEYGQPGPKDCNDVKKLIPEATTGVYRVYPEGSVKGLRVRCDMTTDGGGWTVFQRRVDGSTQFYRNWVEYQTGFGDPETEFWLGNQQIHILSKYGWNELRLDMTTHNNVTYYAKYQVFYVGDARSQYVLYVDGFQGNISFDGMAHHSGKKFSTKDRDNDIHSSHCAQTYQGAWWYGACHDANLNGPYGPTTGTNANSWDTGNGYIAFRSSEMKMRRAL